MVPVVFRGLVGLVLWIRFLCIGVCHNQAFVYKCLQPYLPEVNSLTVAVVISVGLVLVFPASALFAGVILCSPFWLWVTFWFGGWVADGYCGGSSVLGHDTGSNVHIW